MTGYGTEIDTTYLDDNQSTEEVISNISDYKVKSRFRRVSMRVKVCNKKEETVEYLHWTDMIDDKRRHGLLIIIKSNPQTWPTFTIDHPQTDIDGSYFIIRTHTELIP